MYFLLSTSKIVNNISLTTNLKSNIATVKLNMNMSMTCYQNCSSIRRLKVVITFFQDDAYQRNKVMFDVGKVVSGATTPTTHWFKSGWQPKSNVQCSKVICHCLNGTTTPHNNVSISTTSLLEFWLSNLTLLKLICT